MSRTWTEQEREDAILICDIAASETRVKNGVSYGSVALDLGVSRDVADLANEAWLHATRNEFGPDWEPHFDAESAQLLREGWTPSD